MANSNTHEISRQKEFWNLVVGPPMVNCYDQAGLLLICLALNFHGREDWKQVKCYNMKPFGFVIDTSLVGWGVTNNPMLGENRRNMLLEDLIDRLRTRFSAHIFFSRYEKVFYIPALAQNGAPEPWTNTWATSRILYTRVFLRTGNRFPKGQSLVNLRIQNFHQVQDEHASALGAIESIVGLWTRRNRSPNA